MTESAAPIPSVDRKEAASLWLGVTGVAGLVAYVAAACLNSTGYAVSRYASLGGALSLPQRFELRLLGRYSGWGELLFVASTLCAASALLVGLLLLRRDVAPSGRVRTALATASIAVVLAAVLGMLMASFGNSPVEMVNLIK